MSAKRPIILVLTSTYPRWPGDKEPPFVYELCCRLAKDFEVIVLAPHTSDAKTEELWGNVKIIRFRYFFEKWQTLAYNGGILSNLKKNRLNLLLVPLFLIAQLTTTVSILRKYPISVIHAHWIFPQGLVGLIGAILARKSIPVVCTSHGGDLFGLQGKFFSTIKLWVIQRSAALTVVSQAMKDYVISSLDKAQADKISILSMGVDLSQKFTPTVPEVRNSSQLLFVGRLVEKKGLEYLIHAMPIVLRQHPDAHLTIAGSGPEYSKLSQLVRDLQLEQKVSLIGSIHNDQLPSLYRSATIFIAPFVECEDGDQEGLGLVMIEALGCGCPVIASDMPAVRDVIIDGETGLLTKQKDANSLAEKTILLLNSEFLRATLASNGGKLVRNKFDWHMISSGYSRLFSRLIGTA